MNRRYSEGDLNMISQQAFVLDRNAPELAKHVIDLCDQLMQEGSIENKFTEEEKKAISLSADLWDAFIALPEQHPDDTKDFRDAIHTIQRIPGWRPMMRKGMLDV